MKNIWTNAVASVFVLAAGLILGSAALAVEATNSNTGANSDNDATVTIENDTTINSSNDAKIENDLSIKANTGDNTADKNTGDGGVSTGDIGGSVSIENTGNDNENVGASLNSTCSNGCSFTSSNTSTGAGSNNNSEINIKNDFDLTVENTANVTNNVDADLNTGGNSADKNTGDGMVKTGDIAFDISIVNDLNRNGIGIGGELPGIPPAGPGAISMPSIIPTAAAGPIPGQVLAAAAGLPITGGGFLFWPMILLAIGTGLKLLEKVFKGRLGKVEA